MKFKCQCGKELKVIDKYHSRNKDKGEDSPDMVHILVERHSCFWPVHDVEEYYVEEGDLYDDKN